MLRDLRGLKTNVVPTPIHKGKISFTAEAQVRWEIACNKRQRKARLADQEAKGAKPIPFHCHGNTNYTMGGKLKQEEHREWDDVGNTEKAGWLKLPLQTVM